MKTMLLLSAFIAATFLGMSPANAAKVGKAAGKYTGSGTFVDSRDPNFTYTYTFTNIVAAVSKSGKISGSATVTISYTTPLLPPVTVGTNPVTVTGTVKKVKITKKKITAEGQLVFSDGTAVDGKFNVSAKTGKGSFVVKFADAQFQANFTLKK